MRRVVRPGGRIVINTPGAIQPPLAILDEELARQVDPNLSGFVRTVFSMYDPDAVGQLLRDAGLDGVDVSVGTVTLRLPPPQRFLWEYIGSTPLAFFVSSAPEDALDALERSVLERWAPYVEEAGLVVEQPIVTASAVRSSP
jgi:hypothetical protein